MIKKTMLAALMAVFLLSAGIVSAHTVTDITETEFDNLVAGNTVVATLEFMGVEAGGGVISATDGTYTNHAESVWGLDVGNALDISWNDNTGSLELTVTPPSSQSVNVWTSPDEWFDTILVQLDFGIASISLHDNQINGQSFRNLSASPSDQIMIELAGYNASNQPSLTLSGTVTPTSYDQGGQDWADFRGKVIFLKRDEPSETSFTVTDINYEQYASLTSDNPNAGRVYFGCGGGHVGGYDKVSVWNCTGYFVDESTFLNLLQGEPISIGRIDEVGFLIEWDKDGSGRLDATVTPPSGIPETLSTDPIVRWFDTIVIELRADAMGEFTLRNNIIGEQVFENLYSLGWFHTFHQTDDRDLAFDNAVDHVMIRLDGYTASNQPPLTLSTIWKGKCLRLDGSEVSDGSGNEMYGRSGELRIYFLQTEADPEDVDGDDLPDWWETEHFEESVNIEPDDICSNEVNTVRDAYIAGLDPNDPLSFFEVSNVWNQLWWDAASGRVYNIYWTTNLMESFQPLETNFTGNTFTDTTHGVEEKCFYKIDVRLDE